MFSFFQRKKYLVDYLEGFVDIHNHILPGIDDGAKTVKDSIELINGFGEFGVEDFICTPHIMHNYYDNNPETIKASYERLKSELKRKGMDYISIDYAAEHMIDDNFEEILESNKVMPMAKNYLLIEMSYLQASINFEEATNLIASKGYFPILAHPERYVYLHNKLKKYNTYRKEGILFQLNLLSLSDFYGKDVKKMAYKLLDEGLVNFIASDIHNIEQVNLLKQIKVSSKRAMKSIQSLMAKTNENFS